MILNTSTVLRLRVQLISPLPLEPELLTTALDAGYTYLQIVFYKKEGGDLFSARASFGTR